MWAPDANHPVGQLTWQEALDYVVTLNVYGYLEYNDWLLPNIYELESLVNAEESSSSTWLNGQGFINVQSDHYWSSTSYAVSTNLAWFVDINNGRVSYTTKTGNSYVWPVRAGGGGSFGNSDIWKTGQTTCSDEIGNSISCTGTGQDGDVQAGTAWPSPRFTSNSNGTDTDNLTGLVWARDANLPGTKTWQEALDYVAGMNVGTYTNFGHTDWLLPNRKELFSLFDRSQLYPPALPPGYLFTNVQSNNYWSSTSDATNTNDAWSANMSSGGLSTNNKTTSKYYVWPVRAGSGGPSDILSSITSYDFGNVAVGVTSTAQSFTVTNNGEANLVIGTISLTGTDAAEFSIQNDLCSEQTVVASGTCTVEVVFSPTAEAAVGANLSIPSNDPDTPTLDVPLSGTGTCTYSISPTSNYFDLNSGTGSISVTTTSGCDWTTTSSNSFWLKIDTGSSGTGDGTVNYSVTENVYTNSRTGTMTIAGETFTVTQTGTCAYSISLTSNSVDSSGGTDSVSVMAKSGCDWTATSSDTSWLTINTGSSGTGDGTVSYTVSENISTSPRTGTMTIAGETFTVTQTGTCTYSILPTSSSVDSSGGTDSVSVTTDSGCTWTAVSNDSWITVDSGGSGDGDGTVDYSVSENTSTSSRMGTMTIAGESFAVTQSASILVTGDPIPDIMANDSEGTLDINEGDQLSIVISLNPGDYTGTFADWYMVVNTPSGWQSFDISQMDYSTTGLSTSLQDYGLINLGPTEIFSTSSLGVGIYSYYFGIELSGQLYYDSIAVTVEAGEVSAPTGFTASASGDTLTLSWNAVSGADGYYLYYGFSSGDYEGPLDLGNTTGQSFGGIPDGTYYLAVTAYAGLDESGYSNEASVIVNVQ